MMSPHGSCDPFWPDLARWPGKPADHLIVNC
jgi:hypothetical protein